MIFTIILSLLLSTSIYGQSIHIEKGTPAPYTGHLFTEQKAREVRKELIEKDQLEVFTKALLENEKRYKQIITNSNEQVSILMHHNEKLVKIAQDLESAPTYEKIMWFSLGVVATGFAVYGAAQLVK